MSKEKDLKSELKHESFKSELAQLLSKYDYTIICESLSNRLDWSVEIGFQDNKACKIFRTGERRIDSCDLE